MKALVFNRYGPPEEVLQLQEVKKPAPRDNEVLVKIHATSVNDWDWSMVRGMPYPYRLFLGLLKPKHQTPGMELSGTIEAIGASVTSLEVGDAVYGDTSDHAFGSFADYMCVNERALVRKPEHMSFEEAASISHASMLALQALRDIGKIKKGQRILINGAGGGVGTFGLQLAKLLDAEVTGVDTGDKLEMMKDIGFDHILDYKYQDFTRNGERYDLILDCKTNKSPFRYVRCLNPGGTYVTVGGYLDRLLQTLFLGPAIAFFSKKKMRVLALKPNKGLGFINELYEAGKIKCTIDGPYSLPEVPRLLQYFGEGKHTGKVVATLE